jgi:hypothetical protein
LSAGFATLSRAPRWAVALAVQLGCQFGAIAARAEPSAPAAPLGETVLFGAYAEGLPYDDKAFLALESEKKLGGELAIASGFVDFDYVLGEGRDLKLADGGRRTLLYAWEPHCDRDVCIAFRDVIGGRLDPYLKRVADSMRHFPYDIYVRPWAEMNAHWSPFQPGSGRPRAGSIEEFRAAFRYLHEFFRKHGVHNVKFVFNPDITNEPGDVAIAELWPGTDPVDGHPYAEVLGLDGYNWGDSFVKGGTTWTEFDELFRDAYAAITALDPALPVWICEFGTKEPRVNDGTPRSPAPVDRAHDKGAWIEHMMQSTAFPRVRALAYYSAYLPHHDNQRDFRLDSSQSSLRAIRTYLRERRAADAAQIETAEGGTEEHRGEPSREKED